MSEATISTVRELPLTDLRAVTGMAPTDADILAARLRAVADPVRLRLISMIAEFPGAEACVCHLVDPLGLSQPTVSHHLKVLVDAGILTRDKRGVWAYYAVVPGALADLGTDLSAASAR